MYDKIWVILNKLDNICTQLNIFIKHNPIHFLTMCLYITFSWGFRHFKASLSVKYKTQKKKHFHWPCIWRVCQLFLLAVIWIIVSIQVERQDLFFFFLWNYCPNLNWTVSSVAPSSCISACCVIRLWQGNADPPGVCRFLRGLINAE